MIAHCGIECWMLIGWMAICETEGPAQKLRFHVPLANTGGFSSCVWVTQGQFRVDTCIGSLIISYNVCVRSTHITYYKIINTCVNSELTLLLYVCVTHTHELNPPVLASGTRNLNYCAGPSANPSGRRVPVGSRRSPSIQSTSNTQSHSELSMIMLHPHNFILIKSSASLIIN